LLKPFRFGLAVFPRFLQQPDLVGRKVEICFVPDTGIKPEQSPLPATQFDIRYGRVKALQHRFKMPDYSPSGVQPGRERVLADIKLLSLGAPRILLPARKTEAQSLPW
jgi:hypothetical protein